MDKRFTIACAPAPPDCAGARDATVVVDVLRATTTAVTAVACGRRVFPAASLNDAMALAAGLDEPLLAGELGGVMPAGFDMQNSPVAVTEAAGGGPLVLLSTSGTPLLCAAAAGGSAYAACLRNAGAQARALIEGHDGALLLGADSRGEFRAEDQLCCAWIARRLLEAGWVPDGEPTSAVAERWAAAPAEAFLGSRSSAYLRESGQERDLEFVLGHVDDLERVYAMRDGELVECPGA